MKTTTYLFDLDDTIISTKIYAEMYKPVLEMVKKKLNLTDEQLEEKANKISLKKNIFGRWDTGDLCRELGLLEEYYLLFKKQIAVTPVLYDGVIKLFKEIKIKNKKIGLTSNSMSRTIKIYIDKYGLNDYVDFIFSRDDAKCKKKEEKYWKKLIEKENLNPKECLVIGDDELQDAIIPKKCGFQTLLIQKDNGFKLISL